MTIYHVYHKINKYLAIKLEANNQGLTKLELVPEPSSEYQGSPKTNIHIDNSIAQIDNFFNRKATSFSLKLDLKGTIFQNEVWQELVKIPYGQTKTYKEIAENLGKDKAYRAIGNACNKNPFHIIIPCHRILGSNNSLTGFKAGLEVKKYLLEFEQG